MRSRDALTVLYDADCGFCARGAEVLQVLDRNGRLTFVPLRAAQTLIADALGLDELAPTLHVLDGAGTWESGGAACLRIAAALPALVPLALVGRLPLARSLTERLYEAVARNRHRLSRLLGLESCTFRPSHPDRA